MRQNVDAQPFPEGPKLAEAKGDQSLEQPGTALSPVVERASRPFGA
jgi:hypothetical protein